MRHLGAVVLVGGEDARLTPGRPSYWGTGPPPRARRCGTPWGRSRARASCSGRASGRRPSSGARWAVREDISGHRGRSRRPMSAPSTAHLPHTSWRSPAATTVAAATEGRAPRFACGERRYTRLDQVRARAANLDVLECRTAVRAEHDGVHASHVLQRLGGVETGGGRAVTPHDLLRQIAARGFSCAASAMGHDHSQRRFFPESWAISWCWESRGSSRRRCSQRPWLSWSARRVSQAGVTISVW
jgi:hypothetical protein